MFQQAALQKLYPHLQFGRMQREPVVPFNNPPLTSEVRGRSPSILIGGQGGRVASVEKPRSVSATPSERPKKIVKWGEVPSELSKHTPLAPAASEVKREEVKPKEVKPEVLPERGPGGCVLTVPKELPHEPPKKVNCNPPAAPKLSDPKRESVVPKKGEHGTQSKYTIEQKKERYLALLARKSVKRAEAEIAKVNEVLERNNHNIDEIKKEEHAVKGKLKLINAAKFFTLTNIPNHKTTNEQKSLRLDEQSEGNAPTEDEGEERDS